ncbi:MAG: divalent-cation tolerance protein CutA [Thermodesulfobacteriota bacterium]
MKTKYVQVITTLASKEEADKLARHLVEQRLAGCVQVCGPITSFYQWQGTLENDQEFQLQIKSRCDLYDALAAEINKHHPYETPEIVALPIVSGSEEYLSWLEKELRTSP